MPINRLPIPYLIWWLISSSVLLISCRKDDSYESLVNYLRTQHHYELTPQISSIAVVNESGSCINCNKTFSDFMFDFIDHEELLFIICSNGIRMDISPFLNTGKKNILLDPDNEFRKTNLLDEPGVIFLNQTGIDTIFTVNPNSIEKDIEKIRLKL